MEEAIYNLIKEVQGRKSNDGVAPTHVLRAEIDIAVSNALNKLYSDGKISVGRTLNDKWIAVK